MCPEIMLVASCIGDAVALLAGQWTCDSQVASSSPGWAPLGTCVPLSPRSVILYQPRGMISLAGKVTTGLVESNGSLPLFMTKSPAR